MEIFSHCNFIATHDYEFQNTNNYVEGQSTL